MNAPPPRDLYDHIAQTDDADDCVNESDSANKTPPESWIIAAVLAIAALNALRLVLT